ncbi:MAG: FAD:protein FMN transferase [Actinobacteria bacterium]|nr:FAD:protein FMN transferase [Actinomycetota bacterium]
MTWTEHEHCFEALGTEVRLLIGGRGEGRDRVALATRVQRKIADLQRNLTRFDPDSGLSRLNSRAGEWVTVSDSVLRAVRAAIFAARISSGLVDPTLAPHLERAGYTRSRVGLAAPDLSVALSAAPPRRPAAAAPGERWKRIEVDPRSAIRLPRGARLDLGGSAKGLAVDMAADLLAECPAFAVDAGGDIRLGGSAPVERRVEIADPFDEGIVHRYAFGVGAVATSGLRTRLWAHDGGYAHHLIDPQTGVPAWTGVVQATALAPTTLEAEALAKAALLRGPLAGREVLARHGGALVLDSGELVLAGGLGSGTWRLAS